MQRCPKKDKNCKLSICFVTSKKNYICSGVAKRGTKFDGDIVWLCMKGKMSETALEMTTAEALGIISVLTGSLFGLKQLTAEVSGGGEKKG